MFHGSKTCRPGSCVGLASLSERLHRTPRASRLQQRSENSTKGDFVLPVDDIYVPCKSSCRKDRVRRNRKGGLQLRFTSDVQVLRIYTRPADDAYIPKG